MTDNDPAVEAVADALVERLTRTGDNLPLAGILPTARVLAAIAAARPIIEAEVREKIAADIDALTVDRDRIVRDEWLHGYDHAVEDAARIARGEQ